MTVLYNPIGDELSNILTYADDVDLLIVIDNSASSHEAAVRDMLSANRCHCELQFEHHPDNIGLCKALNRGMEMARQEGCTWAMLMDADSRLTSNIIPIYEEYLQSHAKDPIAVLAPIHLTDRSNAAAYEGSMVKTWTMTSGCYYNVGIFWSLGGFQEELFVDGLDMDYGYKATANGYHIMELGAATIQHFPAETHEIKIGNTVLFRYGSASPWRYYMQARSLIWIILRYHSWKEIVTYMYKWFKVLFLFDNKREYIAQMHKGTREGYQLYRDNHENRSGNRSI